MAHLIHYICDFGLGGDALNLLTLAASQSRWAKVSIICQTASAGERFKLASEFDLTTICHPEMERHKRWLSEQGDAVVFIHRNGKPNQDETALLQLLSELKISCFEYNTFARPDPATDDLWTGHFHLSRASLLQYARRRGVDVFSLKKHKAVGYAVDLAPIGDLERNEARNKLKLQADTFVVLRLVRPDLRKWDPLPVLAVKRLLDKSEPFHLVIQSPPKERIDWLRRILGEKVTLLTVTGSDESIRQTLAASDCLVNYSAIGETFGLALAQAMAAGLPVISNSTRYADNAQCELIAHDNTGLIANTVSQLEAALLLLRNNPERRRELAQTGQAFIQKHFLPDLVDKRIRDFISQFKPLRIERQEENPLESGSDSYNLTEEWISEYRKQEARHMQVQNCFLDSLDALYIKSLRLNDAWSYLRQIGFSRTLKIIQERLARGSLSRG